MMQTFEVIPIKFNADIIQQVHNSSNNRSVGAEIYAEGQEALEFCLDPLVQNWKLCQFFCLIT
jgi:hypothetical protein